MRLPIWLIPLAALACGGGGGPHDVAGACADDDDCAFGECYTASDPGYCTAECENEGSTSECPEDTVCKRIEGGDPRCLLVCEDDGDCPDNSDCNPISESDLKGCEPVH